MLFRSAGRPATAISRPSSAPAHTTVPTGAQGPARASARTRTSGRVIHSGNRANSGFNGTDFQDVPGLGFDFPHLAAIRGNRHNHGGRFNGGAPLGFSGFLLSPPVIVEEAAPAAEDPGAGDEVAADAPAAPAPRHARSSRAAEPEPESAPAPPRDVEQYVLVRRDGGLVFAVAYSWENGTLRYITPDGLRRSIGRDALDLNATQQFNEQRGLDFRAPA